MAWNSRETKDARSNSIKAASLGPGAPVSVNTGLAGRPYRDSWDIERAYREGMQKVVWVNRCIDAIAGNQARLPMVLRKDNNPNGQIVDRRNKLLDILNSRANEGENSFIFRYRMSSQMLMSTRGVFIEKVMGRNGDVIALNLLPPQHTSPIPDPRKFVAGFQVDLAQGQKVVLPPERVIWLRRPHPLDPYLSLTPMESAGIAIEIENLARIYNRNFLLNDGRPGGLLVIRGEIDEEDKDELRSRFRGNLNRAGSVGVISSDDGADFVDTASNPRDAAYVQMRQLTKEEILAAFGVPESVIGNASGRTFSNAAEELRVFWMETMLPHLEPIARALDDLDPKYYIDFDTTSVPILIISKQERQRYLMDELQQGLISVNEYRDKTGREKVESEIADQLLWNPNLVPIANTEKPFSVEEQTPIAEAGGVPAPGGAAGELAAPGMEAAPPAGGEQVPGAPAAPAAADGGAPESMIEPVPEGQLSYSLDDIETKSENQAVTEWDLKAEKTSDRWAEILDRTLERFFERQQRVIIEKALGAKSRKAIREGTLEVEAIFDSDAWDRQIEEDFRPIFSAIVNEAAESVGLEAKMDSEPDAEELKEYLDAQVARTQKVNQTTKDEVAAALLVAMALGDEDEESRNSLLRAALAAIFANLIGKRRRVIAEHESQTAMNAGIYLGSRQVGSPRKIWRTRKDSSVRDAHRVLDGKSVAIDDGFVAGDSMLRFPGDPLAPPHLTINCRCRLSFRR
jgi:HK97 family phage portal protein